MATILVFAYSSAGTPSIEPYDPDTPFALNSHVVHLQVPLFPSLQSRVFRSGHHVVRPGLVKRPQCARTIEPGVQIRLLDGHQFPCPPVQFTDEDFLGHTLRLRAHHERDAEVLADDVQRGELVALRVAVLVLHAVDELPGRIVRQLPEHLADVLDDGFGLLRIARNFDLGGVDADLHRSLELHETLDLLYQQLHDFVVHPDE